MPAQPMKRIRVSVQEGDDVYLPSDSVIRGVKVKARKGAGGAGGRGTLIVDVPVGQSIRIDTKNRRRQHKGRVS